MKPLMLVLFVDALGWRLASARRDFAPELPHRREIATVLGFSSGALPTAFSGREAREHGRWLMYRRAGLEPGPFAGFRALGLLPARLRRSWRLRGALTRLVARRGVRGYFNLYDVPVEELPFFDLAEKRDLFAPGGLPVDMLWDALERRGVRWRGWNWRTPESRAIDEMLARVREGDEDFLFLYTADLDATLHREGSAGDGVQSCLDRYEAGIRAAFAAAASRGRPLWLYLCSDHGMVDVTETVDVMDRLATLPARRGRDYVAFYDSTMARFWWRSEAARAAVRAALAGEPRGRWLEPAELAAEGADFARADYGDDVFLLRPGALLLPSFMGRDAVRAMHGYDPAHPDMTAILASNRPLAADVRRLGDLRAFLERELDAQAREAA